MEYTIAGSSSAVDVLGILTDASHDQHPEVTFNYLSGGGSDGGIQGALEGQFDVGMSGRLLTEDELSEGLNAQTPYALS